jgi:hypothetical protein
MTVGYAHARFICTNTVLYRTQNVERREKNKGVPYTATKYTCLVRFESDVLPATIATKNMLSHHPSLDTVPQMAPYCTLRRYSGVAT